MVHGHGRGQPVVVLFDLWSEATLAAGARRVVEKDNG